MAFACDLEDHAGRSGRLFARSLGDISSVDTTAASLIEEEDESRAAVLRRLVSTGFINASAHRGFDPDDVVQIYMRQQPGGPRTFAFTLVSLSRVERMLEQSPFVREGFSLQVADVRDLTLASVVVAAQRWIERNFPELAMPDISLDTMYFVQGREVIAEMFDAMTSRYSSVYAGGGAALNVANPFAANDPAWGMAIGLFNQRMRNGNGSPDERG